VATIIYQATVVRPLRFAKAEAGRYAVTFARSRQNEIKSMRFAGCTPSCRSIVVT
jgi:hypothetical protein